jgi:hypothetical protein
METIRSLLKSKKAVAMITGIVASGLALAAGKLLGEEAGGALAEKYAALITSTVIAYVIGQGVADHGKEAAKEEAKVASSSDTGG